MAGREAALEAQEASVKAREEQVGCSRTCAPTSQDAVV